MKNKNFFRGMCCGIICLILFVSNCFAVTIKEHWWGNEYYMKCDEIAEFRLNVQDLSEDINRVNQGVATGIGITSLFTGPVVGGAAIVAEGIAQAQSEALQRLITDLERWESKGKAIIVSIPKIIQGWNIKAQ